MISSRPYFVRAVYEWLLDNELTPYILVDATQDMVRVPTQFVDEGKIVLNINPKAIANMQMTNHVIEFDARFSGVSHHIHIPMRAVAAIYAFENGFGMAFNEDDDDDFDTPPPRPTATTPAGPTTPGTKPRLKIVK